MSDSDGYYECVPSIPDPRCNYDVGSDNLFTGQVEISNPYYNPQLSACIAFLTLFIISTLLHVVQGIRRKMWWVLATFVCCGIAEILGWGGRLWMHTSYEWTPRNGGQFGFNPNAFLMQISTLIFGPAFWTAGAYITLGRIMQVRGTFYSRLAPKTYTWIFISGDILSIVIQAIGGGLASAADDLEGAENGAKIMVGGIFVQVATMVCYSWILLEFCFRSQLDRPVHQWSPFEWMNCCGRRRARRTQLSSQSQVGNNDDIPLHSNLPSSNASAIEKGHAVGQDGIQYNKRKVNILLGALVFCTVLIFVRSIFRAIELLDGWSGPLVRNEDFFNYFDGLMVVLAMLVMNIAHPSHLLPQMGK